MARELKTGDSIVYIDSQRNSHQALVTKVWGCMGGGGQPGCNLVYVTADETKTDPYGQQIERNTSVCHRSVNPAGANCWCWPEEL
ncbi:MAG TPA: hypothetical protein VG734_25775 [Lacunisphaera sp.]|nr:hypothetical protein [Lacunisphaera sp.]